MVRIVMKRSLRTYPVTSLGHLASFLGLIALAIACSNKVDVLTTETGGAMNASGTGGSTSGGAGGATLRASGGSTGPGATGGASTLDSLPKPCPGITNNTVAVDAGSAVDFDAGAACTGLGVEVEPSPLDIFIMMDRSLSMTYDIQNTTLTRWDVLQQGVQQFLSDPGVVKKAPRVGLGFFSKTGNPNDPTECDPNSYATPVLEIQDIATGGPNILQTIADEASLLGGQTAWQPALQGALMHAQAWQQQNTTGRMTVVVLVTDGYPTECDTNMTDIAETVGEFYAGIKGTYNTVGLPGIRTYVVGIAVNRFNLDVVAQAGGTGTATIIDTAGAVDQFVNTMINITNAEVRCTYDIPTPTDGEKVDPNRVQVMYLPYQGSNQEIPKAAAGSCAGANGGWYFDNDANPTQVTLCPCSCANLGAGSIEFRFGCRPPTVLN